jgi:VanZ family protein
LWLWRAAGFRLLWITTIVAVALFLLEQAQVFLPGRTPEITDSVLAILMGVLLWILRDA